MAVASYSLTTPYKDYPEDQRIAIITRGAFIGASTSRVGPQPAPPVRPAGLDPINMLRDYLDLPEPAMPTTTSTRPTARKTAVLHRRLDLAERLVG